MIWLLVPIVLYAALCVAAQNEDDIPAARTVMPVMGFIAGVPLAVLYVSLLGLGLVLRFALHVVKGGRPSAFKTTRYWPNA